MQSKYNNMLCGLKCRVSIRPLTQHNNNIATFVVVNNHYIFDNIAFQYNTHHLYNTLINRTTATIHSE